MRFINGRTMVLAAGLFYLIACKKTINGDGSGGNGGPGGGGGGTAMGKGTIYYDWATDGVLKLDLATGAKATVIAYNTRLYDFDVSRDRKHLLTCTSAPVPDYDANVYTLSNLSDGTVISQFRYYPTDGDITFPRLSPDESLIGVPPTWDDGIVIMDTKGKVQHHLTSLNGKAFDQWIAWMPDNSLLFSTADGLYRSNASFTQATLIKQFNFTTWGHLDVSQDGKKIAFKGGNHIWMMNSDGSNLVQVTTSSDVEAHPVFSPDGQWLLVGVDYQVTSQNGYWWRFKIIPADGKQYNVDDKADAHVIPVVSQGEKTAEAGSGTTYWR